MNGSVGRQARAKKPAYAIGQPIEKFFPGHGKFKGSVTRLPTPEFDYYHVDYEDGDSETISSDKLSKYIVDNDAAKPSRRASTRKMNALKSRQPNTVKSSASSTSTSRRKRKGSDDEECSPPVKKPARRSVRAKRSASKKASRLAPVVTKSGRVCKSTTVDIGGYTVKVGNNYNVGAESYIFKDDDGDYEAESPGEKRIKKAAAGKKKKKNGGKQSTAATTKSKTKEKSTKRAVSTAERKRTVHNDEIKRREEAAVILRQAFFAENVEALDKFVDAKVLKDIEAKKMNANDNDIDPIDDNAGEEYMQPDLITGELRDYQLAGLNWMVGMIRRGMNLILGDEMGLGKTLQTISLICHLKESENRTGPSLVICPLSVLESWINEAKKWAPDLNVLRLHAPAGKLKEIIKSSMANSGHGGFLSYDVIVTTYDTVKSATAKSLWSRLRFNLVVLDEGHVIKNSESLIAQGVRRIHSESKLLLSGTPLQNNMGELWAILNYLYPEYFTDGSHKTFASAFNITENRVDTELLHSAYEMLRLFMLRRMKTEVEKLMPKKIETRVNCPLSEMQIQLYKGMLLKDINLLVEATEQNQDATDEPQHPKPRTIVHSNLMALFVELRKCCNHPYNFDGVEADIEKTTVEELIAASGKLAVLDMLLRSLFVGGHRVVLFSQYTRNLDIIHDYCEMRGWNTCRFDGSTARAKRNHIVKQFNRSGSDMFIFLMSTRAGGMGLNLQTADTCILFDSDLNPQSDLQAMARVHRLGQTKTVHVYRLVSAGTIEERNVERAQKKLFLDQMVNRDSAQSDNKSSGLTTAEMLHSLSFGSNAVFDSNSDLNHLPSDEDIRHITDRTRSEDDSMGNLKGGTKESVGGFDCSAALTATSKFGGIDFAAIREEHWKNGGRRQSEEGLAAAAQELGKRQKKSRITMVKVDGGEEVPVLRANNYDLEEGETSVFARELSGRGGDFAEQKRAVVRSGTHFKSSSVCQACGEGDGSLVLCPTCPVVTHESCLDKFCQEHNCNPYYGLTQACSHHRCVKCGKSRSAAGGILFPCQACPKSFCEDCLGKEEEEASAVGACSRFEELGFDSTKHFSYINCSKKCEAFARNAYNWTPDEKAKSALPPFIDVSYAFGKKVDAEVPSGPSSQGNAAEERIFKIGEIVDVKARSNNKQGGRGRIIKAENVKYEGMVYDIAYIMGGTEHRVENFYVTAVTDDEVRKPRQIKRVNYHDMQDWSPSPVKSKASKKKKATSSVNALPTVTVPSQPPIGQYDVVLSIPSDGTLPISLKNKEASVRFGGYKKSAKDGSKGPAERLIRNIGDKIVAVGGRSVAGFARRDVKRMIRGRAKDGSILLRLRDRRFVDEVPPIGQYDIRVPASLTPKGPCLLVNFISVDGRIAFSGYGQIDGRKGLAETSDIFRNLGDVLVAVNGKRVRGASLDKAKEWIKATYSVEGSVSLRLEDRGYTKPALQPTDASSRDEGSTLSSAKSDAASKPSVLSASEISSSISDTSSDGVSKPSTSSASDIASNSHATESTTQRSGVVYKTSKPVRVSDMSSSKIEAKPSPAVIDLTSPVASPSTSTLADDSDPPSYHLSKLHVNN